MSWHGQAQPKAGPFHLHTGGGLDRSLPPHLIPKDSLVNLENFYYDGYSILPKSRPGLGVGLLSSALGNAINGVHHYVKDADTSYVVFSSNGTLYYLDTGGAKTTIGSLPNSNPPQFATFNGVLIVACGDGAPLRVWDGATTPGTPEHDYLTVTFTGTPVAATSDLTVNSVPTENKTFTLETVDTDGSVVTEEFTMKVVRDVSYEATIGGDTAATATNIAAAINADSDLVTASALVSVVTLTAKVLGAAGNTIQIWSNSDGALTFSGGWMGEGAVQGKGHVGLGETISLGAQTYMFVHERATQGEVTIGATEQDTAANLVAAIGTDQWDMRVKTDNSATDPNPNIVVEVSFPGNTHGLIASSQSLNVTVGSFAGVSNYKGLYAITTPEAPAPDILHLFNGRLWCAQAGSDRVKACSPFSHLDWSATYGFGVYVDVGLREGNEVLAIGHFKNEVVIHKGGQNPEIYRLVINSPYPSTWSITPKFYENVRVARTAKCVSSLSDRHFYYSNKALEAITGTDAYDEMRGEGPGIKVQEIAHPNDSAFMVVHPDKRLMLVSPRGESQLLCYNYAQNKWSTWSWADGIETPCGMYHEGENVLYWGGADGQLYAQEDEVFTDGDNGRQYSGQITSAVFGAQDLQEHYIKQTIFDFAGIAAGEGTIYANVAKEAPVRQKIADFTMTAGSPYIFDSRGYIWDETGYIYNPGGAHRINVGQVAGGRDFQIDIVIHGGGIELASMTFMLAQIQRDLKGIE